MRCRAAAATPDPDRLPRRPRGPRPTPRSTALRPSRVSGVVAPVTRDFPRALRKNWRFLAIAWALFLLPCVAGTLGALASDDFFTARVLPASQLERMANDYAAGFAAGRDAGTDTGMAGYYVWNNVGIAFRCFATGAPLGTGSIFFLVYNGLLIGTTTGLRHERRPRRQHPHVHVRPRALRAHRDRHRGRRGPPDGLRPRRHRRPHPRRIAQAAGAGDRLARPRRRDHAPHRRGGGGLLVAVERTRAPSSGSSPRRTLSPSRSTSSSRAAARRAVALPEPPARARSAPVEPRRLRRRPAPPRRRRTRSSTSRAASADPSPSASTRASA